MRNIVASYQDLGEISEGKISHKSQPARSDFQKQISLSTCAEPRIQTIF